MIYVRDVIIMVYTVHEDPVPVIDPAEDPVPVIDPAEYPVPVIDPAEDGKEVEDNGPFTQAYHPRILLDLNKSINQVIKKFIIQ